MKKLTITTALAFFVSAIAFAQGPGHQPTHLKDHPRVNQVNRREDNQERRITDERKEGDISKQQAHQDRRNLREINQEKHDMRKQDNGHLTKADQKALNQQLNHNSRKIGQ
ncbi:hypothetical protein [Puia dinghuensis]|uniref:Uncharacterized protein n=1 Tax=Puia dinghuensis TaxID=1792502 RepID=A0A8J2XRE6_9BACT|nr:hypothetical protein [Puia dinghuensis]GGA88783.1 hypothetical protein GCM10011511_10010 [Puia dinghuensis]